MSTDTAKTRVKRGKQKLSDVACKNAQPGEKPYPKADGDGLFLWITPAGGKSWRWQYRFDGKRKLMTFGAYPAVQLADARKKHRQARELLASGVDPMAQRKAEKHADAMTFFGVAQRWYEQWKAEKMSAIT